MANLGNAIGQMWRFLMMGRWTGKRHLQIMALEQLTLFAEDSPVGTCQQHGQGGDAGETQRIVV